MQYTGFPIYDFKVGLYNEKKPWISPADAFKTFVNCVIDRGVIKKRKGHTFFSRFYNYVEDITALTQADPAVVTTAGNHGLATGDYVAVSGVLGMIEINGASSPITVLTATTFSLDAIDSTGFTAYGSVGVAYSSPNISDAGTIAAITQSNPAVVTSAGNHGLSTGDYVLLTNFANGMENLTNSNSEITVLSPTTFQLNDIDSTLLQPYVDSGYYALLTAGQVTGIAEYTSDTGIGDLIVTNSSRVGVFDTTTFQIYDVALADVFTGTVNDSFMFQNWLEKLYFTNNVDRVKSWDGTTLTSIVIDIDGDAANDVDTCKDIKLFGNRLILFSTTEATVQYRQRLRWSGINAPTVWDDTITAGGGFLDVSTSEEFISATYIKDKILLKFTRSAWIMSQTGNVDLPFRVEKIDSSISNSSKNGSVVESDKIWSLSSTGLSVGNGFRVDRFNKLIPEFQDNVEESRSSQIFCEIVDKEREIWMSYPYSDSGINDQALIYKYDENSFSIYQIECSVLGLFTSSLSQTWSGEFRAWNVIDSTWNDFQDGGGYPLTFFGDKFGGIQKMSNGLTDAGKNISMSMKTSRFNPFKDANGQSITAQLGDIHFLLSADTQATLTVDLYINFDEIPYKTITFDLNPPNNTTDKVIKVIRSGAIGQFHRIGIRNDEASAPIEIHMIKPFLRPAGDIKQIV